MMPFIIILAIALTVFWLVQLISLMRMPDTSFPGRFDKPIWAGILLVGSVLGAIAFLVWKLTVAADVQDEAVANQIGNLIKRGRHSENAT